MPCGSRDFEFVLRAVRIGFKHVMPCRCICRMYNCDYYVAIWDQIVTALNSRNATNLLQVSQFSVGWQHLSMPRCTMLSWHCAMAQGSQPGKLTFLFAQCQHCPRLQGLSFYVELDMQQLQSLRDSEVWLRGRMNPPPSQTLYHATLGSCDDHE